MKTEAEMLSEVVKIVLGIDVKLEVKHDSKYVPSQDGREAGAGKAA